MAAPILSEQETRELASAQPNTAFAYMMHGGSGASAYGGGDASREEQTPWDAVALLWGFPYVVGGWVGALCLAPAPSQGGWVGA